jgi:hypothetical protein
MSTITIDQYPFFESNQVLTSTQLNELAAYLDQQTRMTRYSLIGIGALCGLVPSYDSVTNKLIVTEGTGVTSEGYLIETGRCEFTKYRAYNLPLSVEYPPFINPVTMLQVPLWEVLPASYTPSGPEVVQNLDLVFVSGATQGQRKIVLYFMEITDVENDSCLGKSCDTFGAERTFVLRKLLVALDDVKIILANTGSTDLTYTAKFDLPDLLSLRPLFDPDLAHSKDYFQFSQNFRSAAASVYKRVSSDPKDLLNVLRQTYTVFQPILKSVYNNSNPFLDTAIPNLAVWDKIMDGINDVSGPSYFGIQYLYDFFRDLILAYNEFRDAAFRLMSDCCFDTNRFPKHLLLGEAIAIDSDRPSQYRNHFTSVPLTLDQRTALEELKTYHIRMVLMVRTFDVSFVHNPSPQALPPIRITPSFEKWGKLSQRSCPAYYKLNDVDPQLGTLERVWNYQNIYRNRDAGGQYPVVAYGNQSDQGTPISPVETPLFYDLDQFTFLRAEGFLRWNYEDALEQIEALKHTHDLAFNVVALRLQGTATADEIMKRCNFDDLRSQYTAQRNEFICKLKRFFSHFFITTTKGYDVRPTPDFLKALLATIPTPSEGGNSSALFLNAYYALPSQSFARMVPPYQYAPVATNTIKQEIGAWMLQLMNNLIPICESEQLMPKELAEFEYGADTNDANASFILTYIEAVTAANNIKALLNMLNDQITHSTRTRYTAEMYFTFSHWMQEQLWYLNEFINDCQFRTFEAIYYTLQYRIGYMQTNDPTLFSNFIKRNPGVEHKAGVPSGGTLALIYPGTPLNFSRKVKDQFAIQFQEIKNLTVKKELLRSIRGKTQAQNAELQLIEAQLCDLYAQQVTQPARPFTLGAAISTIPIRYVAIDQYEVIADMSLPYLTNCNCECSDIPAPTPKDLALPAIAMPVLYEYFCGDFAFAKDVDSYTTGCTSPAQVQIDVRSSVYYSAPGQQDTMLVLKFVTNGASPVSQFDAKDRAGTVTTISTARGGTVIISQSSSNYQYFTYTPPRNFLGLDSFEYVFELYDFQGNIRARSNKASVKVLVTPRCNTGIQNVAQQQQQQNSTL